MPGITETGWESKTLDEIQDEINQALWDNISPTLNLSETSLLGQFVGSTASQLRQLWEAGAAVYASMDPDQAEGDALDARCRLTGTQRQPASASTALMTITLTAAGGSPAGTYAAGTLRVALQGNPDVVFTNDEDIVTALNVTLTDQPFTCETEGPITANANTLTEIANPVTGFSAPTNPAAAVAGVNRETDAVLRPRRRSALARRGSATVDGIRSDLLNVTGVTSARVVENDTDATVGGIPSHTVACYVLGGSAADVAQAILTSKAGGAGTVGTTTQTATDSQGNVHTIYYTVPSEVRIYVTADVTVVTGQYPNPGYDPSSTEDCAEDAIFNAHTQWRGLDDTAESDTWDIGEDVIVNHIRTAIMRKPGVHDVTSLKVDTVSPPVNTANLTIDVDEYADIDFADIVVNLTYISGAP